MSEDDNIEFGESPLERAFNLMAELKKIEMSLPMYPIVSPSMLATAEKLCPICDGTGRKKVYYDYGAPCHCPSQQKEKS